MGIPEILRLEEKHVLLLDQTVLPQHVSWIRVENHHQMIDAIRKLQVRGAPALGLAAMLGAYLGALALHDDADYRNEFLRILDEIRASRPTAVNLFHATDRLAKKMSDIHSVAELRSMCLESYIALRRYEENACHQMGMNGASLFPGDSPLNIITHCNTGSLATVGIGTALGVIRTLAQSHPVHVYVDETRPLLQGSRLTAWELEHDGISATLITDNMAAWVMNTRKIDLVITGADRIAMNGDSANKIGTLNLAVLSRHYQVPFYITAPETTIDTTITDGKAILIEERNADEVRFIRNQQIAPVEIPVFNPAFDVTDASLISGIITDKAVYKPPFHF